MWRDPVKEILFYSDADGLVAVRRVENTYVIVSNGKPDASIEMDPNRRPTGDEYTMVLAGALRC